MEEDESKVKLGKSARFVVTYQNEKHLVVAFEGDSLWLIKQRLFDVTEVLPHLQHLYKVGRDKEVENTVTVGKKGLKSGAFLELRVTSNNGPHRIHSFMASRMEVQNTAVKGISSPRASVSLQASKQVHAPFCFAFGTGLHQAIAGHPSSFAIFFASKVGQIVSAAELLAEGVVEVSLTGCPADVTLEALSDDTCLVTYLPYSACSVATISATVAGTPIADAPFSLNVRALGDLSSLLRSPGWTLAAADLLLHVVDVAQDYEMLFDAGVLLPMEQVSQRNLQPLQRLRYVRKISHVYEALLEEDTIKCRLVANGSLAFIEGLINSGLCLSSKTLHLFVCKFLSAAKVNPKLLLGLQANLLKVPAEALNDVSWRLLFAESLAASAPRNLETLKAIFALEGCQKAALSLILAMGQEDAATRADVLSYTPALDLIRHSLSRSDDAVRFVVACMNASNFSVDTFQSAGLEEALYNALVDVDVPALWEAAVVQAHSGSKDYVARSAPAIAFSLVDALVLYLEKAPSCVVVRKVFEALVSFVRGADLALALRTSAALNALMKRSSNVASFVDAQGIGAMSELAMRSPEHADDILNLLSQVCKDTSVSNTVEEPVIPWLVERFRTTTLSPQARYSVIVVLIYFARIERYKARVVKSGGFDFLSELIRMVRSYDVAILRKISKDQVDLIKEIGSGACSRVWLAKWDGKHVAVKMFNENYAAFSEKEFGSELAIMSVLRHPNICHAYGGCEIPNQRFLVMPLFRRGSMLDVIRNPDIPISMYRLLSMCLDSATGMAFLHEAGILHRDLKSGNLLVDDNWRVAVVDFGISRMIDLSMSKKNIGTPIYAAPEVLWGKPYSFSADVYSFSFVIWELLSREVPYKQHKQAYIVHGVCNDGLRPPEPKNCPAVLWHLIKQCWAQEPDDRPTFASIVATLRRLQTNVGALQSMKVMSKDSSMTMVMAKQLRQPDGKGSDATKWAQVAPPQQQELESDEINL